MRERGIPTSYKILGVCVLETHNNKIEKVEEYAFDMAATLSLSLRGIKLPGVKGEEVEQYQYAFNYCGELTGRGIW